MLDRNMWEGGWQKKTYQIGSSSGEELEPSRRNAVMWLIRFWISQHRVLALSRAVPVRQG